MVQFKYHILSDGVFNRVAWSACCYAIFNRVACVVVDAINSIKKMVPMTVAWFFDTARWCSTVVARLLCDGYKLIFREVKWDTSVLSTTAVAQVDCVSGIVAKATSGVGIPCVGFSPILFSNTPARGSRTSLQTAKSRFFLHTTFTANLYEVMMSIFRITSSDIKNGKRAISGAYVLVSGVLADRTNGFCFHGTNYTQMWDKFKGKPLRGLTIRRQAEYKQCMGEP